MKNITVTVDDELYRRARSRAAGEGTTVSALVKDALRAYTSEGMEAERRRASLEALFAEVDRRLDKQQPPQGLEPGWRARMYDERFDETVLGRALSAREA